MTESTKSKPPVVRANGVSGIKIDSPEWFDWLESQTSFRYEDEEGRGFTCQKRAITGGVYQDYWSATKRETTSTKPYYRREKLGRSAKVSLSSLEAIAEKMQLPLATYIRDKEAKKKTDKLHTQPSRVIDGETSYALHTQPDCVINGDRLQSENAQLKAEVEKLKQILRGRDSGNQETLDLYAKTKTENERLDKELRQMEEKAGQRELQLAEKDEEILRLRQALDSQQPTEWNCYAGDELIGGSARSEQELKIAMGKKFASWDNNPFSGRKIDYRNEPIGTASARRAEDSQKKLREALEENMELKRQLRLAVLASVQERSQRPDAADLLNRFKAKHKRSKVSLPELEALLDLLFD